jgi:hypothetical protein
MVHTEHANWNTFNKALSIKITCQIFQIFSNVYHYLCGCFDLIRCTMDSNILLKILS